MKLKLILICLILFIPFSCNKWLELLPPEGLTREEFWKSKEDVKAVVMGAYAALSSMDGVFFKFGEIRADMVQGDVNQSLDEKKIMEGNLFPDNSLCNWYQFYKVIDYCNEVIKNAPGVQARDKTFSDYDLKSIMSEAYFIRSLTYFYLVRIYKDVPLILIPTESDNTNIYIPKTDGDEILNHMLNDLKDNINYAPSDYPSMVETKGRATKAAYNALLADISLWTFDYESVITYVQNIEASSSVRYELMPGGEWFTMFSPGNSLESIFELEYDNSLNQLNSTYGLTQHNANNYDPSEKAVELFSQTDQNREIVRGLGVSIKKYGDNDFIIWKYVGLFPDNVSVRPATVLNSAPWIVYRFADVELMKAEALAELGRYSESRQAVNDIRAKAQVPDLINVGNNPTEFEDAILNERSLELAFEGKRWFDLLRMGRRNNYARKEKLIDIILSNVPSTQKRILKIKLSNPLGWYMPIFKTELERNKNLVQNPYYNVSQ